MIKKEILIHNIQFKLRITKHRNDAGVLTLGVTLRPKYKLTPNGSRNMSCHYFSNGVISKFTFTNQKGSTTHHHKISLRESKIKVINYLINEFKIC